MLKHQAKAAAESALQEKMEHVQACQRDNQDWSKWTCDTQIRRFALEESKLMKSWKCPGQKPDEAIAAERDEARSEATRLREEHGTYKAGPRRILTCSSLAQHSNNWNILKLLNLHQFAHVQARKIWWRSKKRSLPSFETWQKDWHRNCFRRKRSFETFAMFAKCPRCPLAACQRGTSINVQITGQISIGEVFKLRMSELGCARNALEMR